MKKIIFVTNNKEKELIVKSELAKFKIIVETKKIVVNEIQSENIEEVAIEKAKAAYSIIKKPLIVMDAGLKIVAFNNFPGPYTKYAEQWFGVDKIIKIMEGESNRKVELQWSIAFADGKITKVFTNRSQGLFATAKKGSNGNWFECAIIDPKTGKTLGEMGNEGERTKFWGDVCSKFGEWFSIK